MFIQSEFNPSIIFFLLWGLFSWLSKNKKQNPEAAEVEVENLSSNNDDFYQVEDEFETLIINQEVDSSLEETRLEDLPEIPYVNNEILDANEDENIGLDIRSDNIPMIENKHWLFESLSDKNKIKKVLILNEVLNKPRSLNPY